jgi:tRNA A37 methylthiotransferase MiaB
MKVLLATSPHVKHGSVLQNDFLPHPQMMYSFAPVGLLSIAGGVRRDRPSVSTELYDLNRRIVSGSIALNGQFYRSLADDILSRGPDVVGMMTECDSYHHVIQVCEAIKSASPGCKIVLGGPHASAVGLETLKKVSAVDAIAVGEAELTFPELLDALTNGTGVPVAGAILRDAKGDVVIGGERPLVAELDQLPIPAYDLYRADPDEEIFVEVGRGCPFQCTFCSTAPYWKRRHRVKSPRRIVSEIELVRNLFGTRRVHFTHDLFTTNRNWVTAVANELIAAGNPVQWTCSARTDTVDRPLLQLMGDAGCNAIYFGLESGSLRILREIKKYIGLDQSFETIEACKSAGIAPNVGFIAGFPTEDSESLRETFVAYERALRAGCKPAHIFTFCPFSDSSMFSKLKDLACSGHFVDIPLGLETDRSNRNMIAGDSHLFSSYFRPRYTGLVPEMPGAIEALDEFSPLVEAGLVPTLELASTLGGIYQVFLRWLSWIRERNAARDAQSYRSGYGTPAMYATFLREQLENTSAPGAAVALARFLERNLDVAAKFAERQATTFATYRSVASYDARPRLSDLDLGAMIGCESVVDRLRLDFDISAVLEGEPLETAPCRPQFLIWQRWGEDKIRLLEVSQEIFELVEAVRGKSRAVGDIVLERLDGASGNDMPAILEQLAAAAEVGVLSLEQSA